MVMRILFLILMLVKPLDSASIQILVPITKMGLQETLNLSVVLEGVEDLPSVNSLSFPGFETISSSTETSVKIVNSNMSRTVTLKYLLKPTSLGKQKIGPIRMQMENETVLSNQVEVEVVAGVEKSASRIFAEASISNPDPYTGEQVFWTFRVYRPVQNFGFGRLQYSLPEFEDVILEKDWVSQSDGRETRDGVIYDVTTVQVPFFPVKTGPMKIPSGSIGWVERSSRNRNVFDDFFDNDFFSQVSGTRKNSYSEEITLNVKELPLPAPDDFKGLIGRFSLEAELSTTKAMVGENITLNLTLTGIGALQDFQSPDFQFPGFKVYEEESGSLDIRRNQENYLGGVKTFRAALIPTGPGVFELPEIGITYFNPYQNTYETTKARLPPIRVEGEASVVSKQENEGFREGEKISLAWQDLIREPLDNFWSRQYLRRLAVLAVFLPFLAVLGLKLKRHFVIRREGRGRYAWLWYRKKRRTSSPELLVSEFLRRLSDGAVHSRDALEAAEILKNMPDFSRVYAQNLIQVCEMQARARWAQEGEIPSDESWDRAMEEVARGWQYFQARNLQEVVKY